MSGVNEVSPPNQPAARAMDSWGNFFPLRVALVVFGVARGARDTQQVGVDDTDATRAFAAIADRTAEASVSPPRRDLRASE